MSGQENSVLVPKAPFITSNELIFPSLHPFGPRYSQGPLNGKRSADMAFSLQKTLEPSKMIRSEENTAQSPLHRLKTETTERDSFKVPKIPQSRKTTEKSNLGVIENGTSQAAARLASYDNSLSLLQSLSFLLGPQRLHMEMMKQSLQMNLQSLFMNQMAKPIEKEFTPEVLTAPESEKSESQENMNSPPSNSDQKTPENKPEFEQDITIVLPGFTDESEVQVALCQNVQAVVPKFHPSLKSTASGRKSPKLVWNADLEKTEKLEIFHAEVEELLEMTITDQQKLSQILKENDYDLTKALARIEKSKGRYKFAFKIKKMLPPKQSPEKSE